MGVTASGMAAPPFRELYRAHYGFVWHAVRRFGVEESMLDDVVQDTFVTAYRALSRFDGSSPRSWLYAIARRVASNHRRTGVRRRRRHDAWQQHGESSDRTVSQLDALHTLDVFLESLAADQREIFVLAELEGMSGGEVATTLSIPASTVYDRLRAVRARFRHHLDERGLAVVVRAREDRPRATARTWALLCLRVPGAALAPIAPRWAAMATAAKLAVGTTAVVGVVAMTAEAAPGREHDGVEVRSGVEMRSDVDVRSDAPIEPTIAAAELPPVDELAAPTVRPRGEPVVRARGTTKDAPAEQDDATAWLSEAAASLGANDPAAALEATDRHARRYPSSPLADVRAGLRIEALCRLGRVVQARGEAAAWLRRAPDSPIAKRAAAICGGSP